MRTLAPAIVLLSTLLTGGCAEEPWTAPSDLATPVIENWRVTATLATVTGPRACFDGRDQLGTSTRVFLFVRREGSTIDLVHEPGGWDLELAGTMSGDGFTASGGWPLAPAACDVSMHYAFEMHVSGRFSADGSTMTATETSTYRLSDGRTIVQTSNWVGVRD
jgi:hypothetical protein